MRWRTAIPGEERIVSRFAWLPVDDGCGEVIWLERYETKETLMDYKGKYWSTNWVRSIALTTRKHEE